MYAGILSGACSDFGGEQTEDEAVFVGAPDRAIVPEETSAGAFLAAEATGAVEEARCKPFEADRHFPKLAIETGNHAIDEATADEGFADDRAIRPLRPVSQEIPDGDG